MLKMMKMNRGDDPPPFRKPVNRKSRNGFSGAGIRLRRDGAPTGKRSRPETPLLRWKVDDKVKDTVKVRDSLDGEKSAADSGRKMGRDTRVLISARKLAAALWRLQVPKASGTEAEDGVSNRELGFQATLGHIGAAAYPSHYSSKPYGAHMKDLPRIPHPAPKIGFPLKVEHSLINSNPAMEGITKWDPMCYGAPDEVQRIYSHSKPIYEQVGAVSMVSALELELKQARGRIHELESEQRSSKKKIEQFLKKLSEERAVWRSREHEKNRAVIDGLKDDLNRERKNRQRTEMVNSKLVNELADAKLSAKRYMQDFEGERKARKLIEQVCDELAKEIGEDKAEVETLKRESLNLRDELEDERKMLQMAEVWREERVQMKLVEAKVTLEEKFAQMNNLIADLETLKGSIIDIEERRKAEELRQAAASVNIKDIREFIYEPSNPEDIFSIFEDANFGEPIEREIEPCSIYSPASHGSKARTVSPKAINFYEKDGIQKYSNASLSHNGELEDDDSGWETVSHVDDQGSSFSPDSSDPCVNKMYRDSNVSGSGTEWGDNADRETPITEISEVCSEPTMQQKKVSSISRMWKTLPNNIENYKIIAVEGLKGRLSRGHLSNGTVTSPDQGLGKGRNSPKDLNGQWSSPESGNTQINPGMKGCIEWPRGSQNNSLKTKLQEARMDTQKIQLRQVLKQKI